LSSAPRRARWTLSGVVTTRCRALAPWAGQAGPGLLGQLWPWAGVSPREQCFFPIFFGFFLIEIQFNSNLIQIYLKLAQTWNLDQITSNL
jgi:hypothetical protein